MDLVADLRAAPRGWPSRRALDLTDDPAILTALANDIGPAALFQRQVIAYGRPGDVAVALSTSGGSPNVVDALAEARRRGLATIAFVGYGGGRIRDERLADHVIVTRSEHVPRIQEAQASAYHVLLELVELATRGVLRPVPLREGDIEVEGPKAARSGAGSHGAGEQGAPNE
jgi:D-sedoheptulose 7-phosphate isomerase